MAEAKNTLSPEQLEIVRWTVRLGAVTAEALARRDDRTVASARAHLLVAERAGVLSRTRLLAERPALYTATRGGLRASGLRGFELCRLSVSNAPHLIACAEAAAVLGRAYPDHQVIGERELRRDEREAGGQLASASLGRSPDGVPLLHRPDLVLWPDDPQKELPVAVEVELTVKAPRRLREICRAWARCRAVAGTVYLAAPDVQRPLARAIEQAGAGERIVVLALDVLKRLEEATGAASASTVPSDA
jgi:hypothetical protein